MSPDEKPPEFPLGHMHSINEPHGSEVYPPDTEEPPPEAGHLPGVGDDPDDVEDEIEQEIDDGDIEPKPTKKRKR